MWEVTRCLLRMLREVLDVREAGNTRICEPPRCSSSGDSIENPRKIPGVFGQLSRDTLGKFDTFHGNSSTYKWKTRNGSMDTPEWFCENTGMVPWTPEYSDHFQRFRISTLNSMLFSWFWHNVLNFFLQQKTMKTSLCKVIGKISRNVMIVYFILNKV